MSFHRLGSRIIHSMLLESMGRRTTGMPIRDAFRTLDSRQINVQQM